MKFLQFFADLNEIEQLINHNLFGRNNGQFSQLRQILTECVEIFEFNFTSNSCADFFGGFEAREEFNPTVKMQKKFYSNQIGNSMTTNEGQKKVL